METFDSVRKCSATALRVLSLRDRSIKELEDFLISKGFDPEIVSTVISDLVHKKFLNDREFAEKWVRFRLNRGKGERIIRYELKLKGVSEEDIDYAFNCQEEGVVIESAVVILTKKTSKFSHLKPYEQQFKMRQILVQKGFSSGVIRAAIDVCLSNRVK